MREDHRDRLHLRNHHQHGGAGRLHHVAGIHQSKTHPPGDRRSNVAVAELHLVVIHGALIVLHRALVLQHDLLLVVQQLLVDSVARPRRAIAFQVHLRLRQNIGVALQRALGLHQLRLVGPRIDLDQRIALLDELAFAVVHRGDHSAGLRGNRCGINRRHRADRIQVHADVAFVGCCHRGRYGSAELPTPAPAPARRRFLGRGAAAAVMHDKIEANCRDDQQDSPQKPWIAIDRIAAQTYPPSAFICRLSDSSKLSGTQNSTHFID